MDDTSPTYPAPVRQRDDRIDALRGLAISLVVLGHCLIRMVPASTTAAPGLQFEAGLGWVPISLMANPLLNVIYTFHMPLFAFLSGFVLLGSSIGYGWRLVKRRFLALMVPYFSWMFASWALGGERSVIGLLRFMGAGVLNDQAPGSLWFLYALFVCIVCFAVVSNASQSETALVSSAVFVGALGLLPMAGHEHFLGVSEVAWIYPFFVAGFISAKHRSALDGLRYGLPLALGVWMLSLPLVWPITVTGSRWWFSAFAATLAAGHVPGAAFVAKGLWASARVAGAMGGVFVSYYAYTYIRGGALRIQAWVGRRSLGIYAIHGFFLTAFGLTAHLPRLIVMFAFAMTGSIAVTWLMEKSWWTRIVFLGMRGNRRSSSM